MSSTFFHLRAPGAVTARVRPWLSVIGMGLLLASPRSATAQNLQDALLDLPGVWAGQAAWADYDGDGDADLILTGEVVNPDGSCRRIARILRNDGGLLAEDVAQTERLLGVYFGDTGWADYDSDGDLDLAIAGWAEGGDESLTLYLNGESADGRELTADVSQTDLLGVRYADIAWGDVDRDGDLDLVVSGMDANGFSTTRLYRNDRGRLSLDEVGSDALLNVHNGELAWADYDNDGDLDLSLAGENVQGSIPRVTEFYVNEPTGSLSLDSRLSASVDKLSGGDLAWGDYDGDGNLDLAQSGRSGTWNSRVWLFVNRPAGTLTFDATFLLNSFLQVDGDLDWVDYDHDGDLDLAAGGRTIISQRRTFVFPNDGGELSEVSAEGGVEGFAGGFTVWADYDQDGRVDLLQSGLDANSVRRTVLYTNSAPENAPPTAPPSLNPVRVTSTRALFSWSPASDDRSALLSYNLRLGSEPGLGDLVSATLPVGPGNVGLNTNYVMDRALAPDTYYWSVQAVDGGLARSSFSAEGQFVVGRFVSSDQSIRSIATSAMGWGDVDGDGDPDLALMGTNRSGEAQTLAYVNRNGVLELDTGAGLTALTEGDLAWGDYDGDGDLDLFTAGRIAEGNRLDVLYRVAVVGDDSLSFEQDLRFRPDLDFSAAAWGDIDLDGDLDLVYSGQSGEVQDGVQLSFSRVWTNDGAGSFVERDDGMAGLSNGDLGLGDVDGDGDLDVLLTGKSSTGVRRTDLYTNELENGLVDAAAGLEGLESSDLALGDYDRDGDLDLALGGLDVDGETFAALYDNSDGLFTASTPVSFPGIQGGDLTWADYDNDQDLDLVIAGNDGDNAILQIWENTIGQAAPDSAFELASVPILVGIDRSAVAMVDADGDGDLDLVSSGRTGGGPATVFNDNLASQQANANLPPEAPSGFAANDAGNTVRLTWAAGSDVFAPPAASLTYNLRVGTSPGASDVLSAASDLGPGNVGHNLFRDLRRLDSGTYFWSVQTVDASFDRSSAGAEQSFVIDTVAPEVASLSLNRTSVGLGQTVSLALELVDRHSGMAPDTPPTVTADVDGQTLTFQGLQFTGTSWSGELVVDETTPSGVADISISGAVDLKDNQLSPFDSLAAFVIDAERPTIVSRSPADSEDIPSGDGSIRVEFSEAVDAASLTDAFQLRLGVLPVAVAADVQDDGLTVVLTPATAFLPGTEYTVSAAASIADLAGNVAGEASAWSFRTIVPALEATTPADGDSAVDVEDSRIEARFSAPILRAALATGDAVQVLREGVAVALEGTPVFDDASLTLVLQPAAGLRPGSRYEVVLGSLIGGQLRAVSDEGDFRWSFTTAVPQLTATVPADADTVVNELQQDLVASFSDLIDVDQLAQAGSVRLLEEGAEVTLADPVYDASSGDLRLTPTAGLRPGTRYQVVVAGLLGGPRRVPSGDYRWSFATAVPELVSTAPAAGDSTVADLDEELVVTFDNPIDAERVAQSGALRLLEEGVELLLEQDEVTVDPATNTLRFEPEEDLRPGARYQVVLNALAGGPRRVAAGDYAWTFATAVPQVVSLLPADGDSTVTVDRSDLSATFDTDIDTRALQADDSVQLFQEGRQIPISAPVYDPDTGALTVSPTGGLRAGTGYRLQIAADVRGPRADGDITWSFATLVPQVVSTSPVDGASVTSGPRRIQVQLSSAVDVDRALRPANYAVSLGGLPLTLEAAEILYDNETFTVSLPSLNLLSGSAYNVSVSSRLGGPLSQAPDHTFSFLTDIPTVIDRQPAVDAEGVSTDQATVTVSLSGPIARQDAEGFTLRARNLETVLSGEDDAFELVPITGFGTDSTLTTVNFAPVGGFSAFTEYEVEIDPQVFGQRAEDAVVWRFSTASQLGDAASGGVLSNTDGSVRLYFPPNGLSGGSGEIAITPDLEAAGKPAGLAQDVAVGRAFRIDAGTGVLRKPATLTMGFTQAELGGADADRLGIFRRQSGSWVRVGGTANATLRTVTTSIEQFGTFALFQDLSAPLGSTKLRSIDCQPQAFAPAGGDLRSTTDISFELTAGADVTVRVYNAAGRLERVVARDQPMAAGRNSLPWDGRDEDADVVASGLYIVVVSADGAQAEKIVAVVR